ncbi:MAG: HAMP domain-containing histidine kinase [Ignavibacteriales bacterium]|nr:HAMP domain-containing histidine kinase [Ignavibacteriales bacterium]
MKKKIPNNKKKKVNKILSAAKKNNKPPESKAFKKLQYEFISSVSHQLRTPLAEMQSSVDLLELYTKNENKSRQIQAVDKIKRSVNNLKDTIEQIAVLYKHELKKQRPNFALIDPRKFINELLDDILMLTGSSHFINVNFETEIKQIFTDEIMLKQILLNLLDNSIKFSPEGGQIQLSIKQNKKNVEISVKDEGIGITKSDYGKLYQPFYRGNNVGIIPGIGLGLAIVKKLTAILKVKIECYSQTGRGTEFILKIPQPSQ